MKRSTRLLSLLLAALMLLTAPLANVSTAAADGKTIKEIELSIIPPIAGTPSRLIDVNDVNYMISVPAAAEYHAVAAMWYTQNGAAIWDPSTDAEYTFEAGNAYRLGIMLQANDNVNDSFSTDITEKDIKITGGSLFDIQFQGGGDHLLYLTAMVRALDINNAIETVSYTINPPVAGASSAEPPVVTIPSNVNYSISAGWYNTDGSWSVPPADFSFETGKTYKYRVNVQASDGHAFSEAVKVSVNGVIDAESNNNMENFDFPYISFYYIASVTAVQPESCSVTFDANGGSGEMDPVSVNKGAEYELPACSFTAPEGKEFDKWDKGAVGDKITISVDTVIKALWKDKAVETCTITFDANGGSGKMDPVSVSKGAEYELPACSFTAPEGQEFDCWDKGAVGDKITISADTTVKAQWKDKTVETCTITFNPNGGSGKMASVTVEKGSKYTLPKCTFTPPYSSTFTKWNLGKVGAKITITADTILKAQWKIVKTNPKLTAKNKSFKIKTKTKKYTVTLKDSKGKAIKGAKLTLKVNKKTYTAKTNSKGKATFKFKLTKKGKFNATITYAGNKYFKKISKTVKITVK